MIGPKRLITSLRSQRLQQRDRRRLAPQEAAKRAAWRRLQQPRLDENRSIPTGQGAAESSGSQEVLLHPWWQHLPSDQRGHRQRFTLLRRRLWVWLRQKPQRIGLAVILYLGLCSLPLAWGLPLLGLVAMLPLLLVPPVGWLVYRLVWHDFHH